jgi:hypothetical protein
VSLDHWILVIVCKTGQEFLEVCRRAKAGEFSISVVEVGYSVERGKSRNGKRLSKRVNSGYTVHEHKQKDNPATQVSFADVAGSAGQSW